MNILVIGNGFDLAHGLPTRYVDFLKYVGAFKRFKEDSTENISADRENVNSEEGKYISHFENLRGQNPQIYEEIDELISNNYWIEYFWSIYENCCESGKDGWIDFESEISRIIQTLDEARLTILTKINKGQPLRKMTQRQLNILDPVFGNGLPRSCDSVEFDEKAVEIKKQRLLKDLNRLTRCLEIYLIQYVEKMASDVKLPDIEQMNINNVLSFNYTHTYNKIYQTGDKEEIEYDYIHGETQSNSNIDKCNLILGIDEYLEGYAKDNDNAFIQFKKFYQRIYKKTSCKYIDWINKIIKYQSINGNNVYIFGHSLDVTDKDILSRLINMENTKTTIFYHDQKTLGKMINNLVKVLGEDALIAKVHGKDASVVLKKQQETVGIGSN